MFNLLLFNGINLTYFTLNIYLLIHLYDFQILFNIIKFYLL